MPRAELPTSLRGWMVALGAAFVGFIAGFIFISFMTRTLGR